EVRPCREDGLVEPRRLERLPIEVEERSGAGERDGVLTAVALVLDIERLYVVLRGIDQAREVMDRAAKVEGEPPDVRQHSQVRDVARRQAGQDGVGGLFIVGVQG